MLRSAKDRPRRSAWDRDALRDPHAQPDKAARIEAMFDAIAPTYELVNSITTFGRDAAWRRRAVAAAQVHPGDIVLDICCGTGDMLRAFAQAEARLKLIVGVDFSAQMLGRVRLDGAAPPIHVLRADALRLPLTDAAVDAITCAFGVRNFRDMQAGLNEMHRVARPGARVVILEFATPRGPLVRWAYRLYCERVLPLLAWLLSRDRTGAYRYLPRSIRTFETAETMVRRLEDAGFGEVELWRMNLGGVVLYRGVKRGGSSG
jgi:demethylmenaquinone methyltransferase/2-methoxy-6-polyprenyl-1,4-benzoquinol methylase